MKSAPPAPQHAWRQASICLALAGLALPAAALYKVIEPDGRISYTDRPPSDGAARVTTINRSGAAQAPAAPDILPPDLRQTATRYPVTLYATADCPPCDSARQWLLQRGVPYTEKSILNDEDVAAMERAVGARTVPSLTIGAQSLRGMSQSEWASYLDAAGYPRESKLPKSWQPAPATPLVARSSPRSALAPAAAASPPTRGAPADVPVLPAGAAGIRF
jgi:glutaredoxin